MSAEPEAPSPASSRRALRNRRLIHAGISSVAVRGFTGALGLVSVPVALAYLGKDSYGLWMVMTSLVAWMALGDLGITRALQNSVAEADGRGAQSDIPSLVFTGFVGLALVAGLLMILAGLLAILVPWNTALRLTTATNAEASEAFLGAAIVFILGLPLSVAAAALIALQQSYLVNWSQVGAVAMSLAGLLAAISVDASIGWVIFLGSAGPLLVSVWLWHRLRRHLRHGSLLSPSNFRSASLARLARSSVPVLAFQLGALAVNQAVVVLLARAAGLSAVADFSIVMKLYVFLFSIGAGLSLALAPAVREAYERKDKSWAARAISRTILVRVAVSLSMALPLVILGDWIIRLWTRQELYPPLGIVGWSVVAMCMMLASMSSALSDVLIGLDDTWPQVALVMLTAAVVLPVVILFAPEFGLVAVFGAMAISTLIPLAYCQRRLTELLAR